MESTYKYEFNEYQTPLTEELLASLHEEVRESLIEAINTVPFIRNLISKDRKRAKDLERDNKGRIIIDLCNPHILEDMEYFLPARRHYEKYGVYTYLKPNGNPNSAYFKYLKEEVRRCLEGYVRESDGEWVPGDLYFQLNYAPMLINILREGTKIADRTMGFADVWEGLYWRYHYLDQARNGGKYNDFLGGNHAAELARRGAHPYSQKVYTPDGIKLWRDIKIGDTLFDRNGGITKVLDIPFDRKAPVYKITLRDGREILASDDHLWNVYKKGVEYTMSTLELLASFKRSRQPSDRLPSGIEYIYKIKKAGGVEYAEQNLPIDPYTMGLLLGDGCFRVKFAYLTQAREDFLAIEQHIPYTIDRVDDKCAYKIRIPQYYDTIVSLGLYNHKSESKFIPDIFKRSSKEQRLNLLRGLLDADGYTHGGVPEISTSSIQLRDDIMEIARSLGYNAFTTTKKSGYRNSKGEKVECLDAHIITIYAGEEVFNLGRKKQLVENKKLSRREYSVITNIEYVGEEQCKCVTVDADDSCYLIGEYVPTHNCGKSYSLASIMAKHLILGENSVSRKKVITILVAYLSEYLADKDGTMSKFVPMIDFCASNTGFPRLRLNNSMSDMLWRMGYKDSNGVEHGSLNSVMGISVKDNEGKIRGKRGWILFEEFGTFPNLLGVYNNVRPSVEEGDAVYGLLYLVGTAGDKDSDFFSAQELMYHPSGYNIYALPNVFDKEGQGKKEFSFFFPGYINRKGNYNKDGVSDVIGALIEIYNARLKAKYNTSDINTIVKVTAEIPVTPQEAILKVKDNLFPISELSNRLNEIDNDPSFFNRFYPAELLLRNGKVEFVLSQEIPIRDFPLKGNKHEGCIEIFAHPELINDAPIRGRYIIGVDPYDNDAAESSSLGSIIVLDLFTDTIVAEYTGRPAYADDFYEIVRRLALYYNARVNYENNKKGLYAYFSKMNSLYLLEDTLEYLKDKQLLKAQTIGNSSKGVPATTPINSYARGLLRDWLLKPITTVEQIDGEEVESTRFNLYNINSRALLKELINWNPEANFDRVSAMLMVMLYRESCMLKFQGDINRAKNPRGSSLANDKFFTKNYKKKNPVTFRFTLD